MISWPIKRLPGSIRRWRKTSAALAKTGLGEGDIDAAAARLERFRPFLAAAFPETQADGGLIESPLRPIPAMQEVIKEKYRTELPGKLLLKCDNLLPIAGSIKARGGIYEVLKYAEEVALARGLVKPGDDYTLLSDRPRPGGSLPTTGSPSVRPATLACPSVSPLPASASR